MSTSGGYDYTDFAGSLAPHQHSNISQLYPNLVQGNTGIHIVQDSQMQTQLPYPVVPGGPSSLPVYPNQTSSPYAPLPPSTIAFPPGTAPSSVHMQYPYGPVFSSSLAYPPNQQATRSAPSLMDPGNLHIHTHPKALHSLSHSISHGGTCISDLLQQ